MLSEVIHRLVAMLAAFLAGGINSVAGGGTLVTFPALFALGLNAIRANTTSTIAIWPGSMGSMWGFRKELGRVPRMLKLMAIPTVFGGLLGAWLLQHTPASVFERMVPFLILFATLLFSVQGAVQKRIKTRPAADGQPRSGLWLTTASMVLFAVGVYGGYFGAGMSIMLLSVVAFLGLDDILEMSALTSLLSFTTNGVASLLFAMTGMVEWSYVLVMMAAALLGGYGAAGVARRIGKLWVRRFVIAVGLTIATVLLVRMLRG